GHCELERGELVWPADATTIQPVLEPVLDLALQADFTDLAPLGSVIGHTIAGRWKGALDVKGPLRTPTGRFVGRGEALQVAGITLDTVDLDVTTDGHLARFERCEMAGPELEAV